MSYTFSLNTNFNGDLYPHQLYSDIIGNSSITKTLDGIDTNGDIVTITFTSALSGSEVTALNNVITNYIYIPLNRCRIDAMTPNYTRIGTLFTSLATTFYFDIGSMLDLCDVKILSNTTGGNYTVRLYDITNSKLMASATFTNTSSRMNLLGTISNIPTNNAMLEVHVKTSSVLYNVTISKVIIYYR